ncbi:MAG TPA: ATP-binding protein, partial [Chitinophagaceae bacterium]|nr:ATP-binding protein [Chitinophagaceae bacterium]
MSDSSTISLAEIRERLAQAGSEPPQAPAPAPAPETGASMDTPFTEAAAVLIFYDPATINPISGNFTPDERKKLVTHLMGCSEMLSDSDSNDHSTADDASAGYELHFSLPDECRKKMLRLLFERNLVAAALQANPQDTINSKYALQRIFTLCLQRNAPDIMNLDLEELNSLYKVSSWLADIKGAIKLPDRKDILHRIEMVEMLNPMKHLTGVYRDGVFQVMFRGRQKELSTLRSYVGVAPPQGVSETIGRIFEKVWPFGPTEKKPLLIFGQGGIGKSTLLAKFILEHAEAQKKDRFPFVYLDFDRPNLSALEPETLLIEAARLLSIQYRDIADLSEEFLDYYWKWNDQYVSLIDASQTQSISLKSLETSKKKELDRTAMQQEFLTLIRKLASHESRPFLLLLDTFEEVQYKGTEYVRSLYDFVQRLRTEYPLLRTIIAGRAPVPEIDTYKLELTDLDREAAEGYLTRVGITNPADAKLIAAQIGGNPLTLKLAAELVQSHGQQELLAAKADAKQQQGGNKTLPEMQLQGILYRRILGHLHGEDVQKLAHPGMVLRSITPDLILKVLAGPCGLNVQTPQQAQALFEQIAREVSLVTIPEPGVLRHRTDIRKVMLKLIEQEKKDVVLQIHRAAADYYNGKESMADRAERLYHLLALDYSREDLESLWDEGMQNYLMGSVDELPPRGQAFLLAKTGRESNDDSVWESADMEDRNRRTAKQAARLLNSG